MRFFAMVGCYMFNVRHTIIRTLVTVAIVGILAAAGVAWAAGKGNQGVTEINSCTTITVSGSYKLVANIDAPVGGTECIVISANNVQLDGNGFRVGGGGALSPIARVSETKAHAMALISLISVLQMWRPESTYPG